MNLGHWKFFKQQPFGEEDGDAGGSGQGDSTADDFSSSEADDKAAEEGAALLAEGDDSIDPESTDEEQSDEDQGQTEEEDEEAPAPVPLANRFKDEKTGNWDWKKISKVVGSPELEKTFKETQSQITKVSQENKTLREQSAYIPQLQQRAQMMDHLDSVFHTNPGFRAAVQKALGVSPNGTGEQEFELPPGVNPDDPLVPLIVKQQRFIDGIQNWQRTQETNRRQSEGKQVFMQGLKDAASSFAGLVGRAPSEDELRLVAEKMRTTNHLQGSDWVPSLFVKEIQEKSKRDLYATRNAKRNLPSKGASGAKPSSTQKPAGLRAAFEESWDENMG